MLFHGICWICLLIMLPLCLSQFSDDLARRKFFIAAAAALSNDSLSCLLNNFDNVTMDAPVFVNCDLLNENKPITCKAINAISFNDSAIILSFRGSVGSDQISEEKTAEAFVNKVSFPGGGSVAWYFWNASLLLWNTRIKDNFFTMKNAHPSFDVWVTGHSLGGAMASLIAGYIVHMGYMPKNKVKLITFGQPRTGDGAYADFINTHLDYTYRVVHSYDPVPHAPLLSEENITTALNNYTHHRNEIWYNNSMIVGSTWLECDTGESEQCSDQIENFFNLNGPNVTLDDHLTYYNVSDIGTFANGGCSFST